MSFTRKILESIPLINSWLYGEKKELRLIHEGKDLPSPLARISSTKNLKKLHEALKTALGEDLEYYALTPTKSEDPFLDQGHIVFIKPISQKIPFRTRDLVPGDMILFRRKVDNKESVLHRIISVHNNFVITKGDNNVLTDGPIPFTDIKGILVGIMY